MISVLLLLVMVASSLWARTLHVPTAAFPTVQAGLDSLRDEDTVAVALGTYAESLQAPAVHFVLKGDVIPDTGDYPRPIIDPTPLPGSDSLCCLILPLGCDPVIEDMCFRNGPAMYPRLPWHIGGVKTGGPQSAFHRCVFDSTYDGIFLTHNCNIELQECRFLNVWNSITSFYCCGTVHASDCLFTGGGATHVSACGGCWLERCRFASCTYDYQCNLTGSVSITDCEFRSRDPDDICEASPLFLYRSTGVIENNIFRDLRVGTNSIVGVVYACDLDTGVLQISHNRFVNNSVGEHYVGSTGIVLSCNSFGRFGVTHVKIDSSLFEGNSASGGAVFRGIGFDGAGGSATGNHFHNLKWDSTYPGWWPPPVVNVSHSSKPTLRANRFDSTGLAVMDTMHENGDTVDARGNWWGDPTGPYHPLYNPQGRGDTVQGRVNISGWCLDTACTTTEAAKDPFNLHPSSFRLSTYPNPFNSTTVLHLEVPQAEIVRLEIFDILGRRVRELWSGVVADEKEIAFDGSTLASGVYFIRATNTIWNRPLISTKIVLLR